MSENLISNDGTNFGVVLGTTLSRTITERLGVRLQFPDKSAEMQELTVLVDDLASLEISEKELANVLQAEQTIVVTQAQIARVDEHNKMLAKDKVLTSVSTNQESSTYTWQTIAPQAKMTFATTLDSIRAGLLTEKLDDTDEPRTISEPTELEIVSLLEAKVSSLLAGIIDVTPLPTNPSGVRRLGQLAAKAVGHRAGQPYYQEFINPKKQPLINSSKVPVQVSRKVRDLNKLLSELKANPHSFLAGLLVEQQREDLEQKAIDSLDSHIVILSKPYLAAAKVGKRVLHRASSGLEKVDQPEAPEIAQPVVTEEDSEIIDISTEESLEMLGVYELKMPWMPGGTTSAEVQKLTKSGQAVYITRGLAPKLSDISTESRGKTPLNSKGLNKYDAMAQHMARAIALGHMPNNSRSNVKRVSPKKGMALQYANVPIWYPPDAAPNTPRMYFTIRKMGDLIEAAKATSSDINTQDYCVIVLAETDKNNQDEVYMYFTGQSKRSVRSAGSGK